MSKITRINVYDDNRFDEEVLKQHGAFIVDDNLRCGFKIINEHSAVMNFDQGVEPLELIDEFRFYSEHITRFYDENMKLIKEFPLMETFFVGIEELQPSQFFVDMDKVNAVGDFLRCEEDIYIPITKVEDRLISLDGHTRLYYATTKGFKRVKAFFTEPGEYIEGFVEEAQRRNINTPYDLQLVSHEEYKIKWNKFCDDFFKAREEEELLQKV